MNIPKLRFKEFTDSYKKMKYKDVLKIKSGKDQKRIECNNGKYPILGTGGKIGTTNMFLYNKPSVLIGRKGTINKPQYMETPFWTVDTLFYSQIYKPNIPKYLFYSFQNVNWQKYDESTGVPSLSSSTIESVECFIPSIDEQIKISNFLSLLDKKIELQTKKIEALKLFKLSITQNIFNEKKLNDFQSVTLEKILKPGSKIPVKNTSEYEKMTVKLNFKGLAKLEIKKEMADTRPFYVRNENEIIIGKQNYFNGSIAKVTKDFKGCICSNAIMSFTTINGVNVDYVLYYLSQKNYINRRKFLANGTGQKELSEKEFLKFVIKLPSTQIQNNISKKISCVSNLLLLENEKLTILNNLKKGLLQNLFV